MRLCVFFRSNPLLVARCGLSGADISQDSDHIRRRRRSAELSGTAENSQKTTDGRGGPPAGRRAALSRRHWSRRVLRRLLYAGKPVSGADNKTRPRPAPPGGGDGSGPPVCRRPRPHVVQPVDVVVVV